MSDEFHRFSPVRFYRINLIFLIPLMIAAVLVFLILTCTVEEVSVKGNTLLSDTEIENYVLNDRYKNNGAWDVVKNTLREPEIPFAAGIKVRLSHFHHLEITVTEKELTGYLRDSKGRYVYLDRNGIVTEVDDRLLGTAIPVEGLDTKKNIVTGQKYPAAENRVSALSTIFKSMKNLNLDIKKVTFGDSGQITLDLGKVTASLGTADRLKDKLLRLSYIVPKVGKDSGVLHFENFTEDNTDVVFERARK